LLPDGIIANHRDFVTGSGNQTISNTATNLGRNTVATNYWTDLSLNNEISDPMLMNISRTNVGALLDPRPQANSPALLNYAKAVRGQAAVSSAHPMGVRHYECERTSRATGGWERRLNSRRRFPV
jgi:hypothetical protein